MLDFAATFQSARLAALWNAIIPKVAMNVEIGATHTTYLHPTKGLRRVSNARLGIGSNVYR